MIKACADNSEFETPTGLFQALISPAIILLRGRDTGMAHRILDRDDVLTIVQHGRCKGSAKIMWSEFFQPCLNSPGFKNVIDSLVRHSVGGDIIKPPDPLKQSSGLLTTNLIHPTHKPLPSPVRHISDALFVTLTQHPKRLLPGDDAFHIEGDNLRAPKPAPD